MVPLGFVVEGRWPVVRNGGTTVTGTGVSHYVSLGPFSEGLVLVGVALRGSADALKEARMGLVVTGSSYADAAAFGGGVDLLGRTALRDGGRGSIVFELVSAVDLDFPFAYRFTEGSQYVLARLDWKSAGKWEAHLFAVAVPIIGLPVLIGSVEAAREGE